MQHKTILAITAVLLAGGSVAQAQTLLNKLENQLQAAQPAAAPVASSDVVYMGMVPDETDQGGRGVRVQSVTPGGPAETGGLKAGDLITAIDGKPVTSLGEFDAIYDKAAIGQKLAVTVHRIGGPEVVHVTLGSRPARPTDAEPGEAPLTPSPVPAAPAPSLSPPSLAPPAPAPSLAEPALPPATAPAPAELDLPAPAPIRSRPLELGPPPTEPAPAEPAPSGLSPPGDALPSPAPGAAGGASLGITVEPLTEEARSVYGLAARRGALITGVRPGSPADRVGLPVGGLIVRIEGRPVDSPHELVAVIRGARPGQEVELTYYEGDRLARKTVRLAPAAVAAMPALPGGEAPSAPPLVPGGRPPLLGRVERMVDSLTSPRGPSTVYDPSELAAVQNRVRVLEEQLQKLEGRLQALESKLSPTPAAPAFGGSFSAPATNP